MQQQVKAQITVYRCVCVCIYAHITCSCGSYDKPLAPLQRVSFSQGQTVQHARTLYYLAYLQLGTNTILLLTKHHTHTHT